jgi:CBS domain-containing protein
VLARTTERLRDSAGQIICSVFRQCICLVNSEERDEEEGRNTMRVKDIMSAPADTCRPETDLGSVTRMMLAHDLGFIPVVGAAGTLLGLVTDLDICKATVTRRLPPCHISAAQAMTDNAHVCSPDDGIGVALASMSRYKVRGLPVVDSLGSIKGIISMNDIVRTSGTHGDVPVEDVIAALAEICAPRQMVTMP